MINTKKYLFFLISFLLVVLYLHPASALAANKIMVSYQCIDEDTGEIFKVEHRNVDRMTGRPYTVSQTQKGEYGYCKEEAVSESIEGENGEIYMFDFESPKNVLTIESLSENPKENVLRIYYKSYRLKDSENSVVIVSCIDEDSNAIIKTEDIEIEQYRQKHFSYDIEFILKDENGLSYRYDSECSKKCERIVTVQQNAFRNHIKLYYKRGELGEKEAIVSVYRELRYNVSEDLGYYKKEFIEGLKVGDDFYLDKILPGDLSELYGGSIVEYDYYWGEEEKFYIEELSADLTKNIVRTINHGWDILGGHMNKEQVVIELIDADTGKAFRTDRRYVFIESTRTYPAPNKLTTDNGNVYYFDKDNKNNHLSIKVSKIEKGGDVYKTGNVIKAYYFTKKNPGDPAAVRISYMDSATGKLVRQEDKDGLIVGESYLHQPEESFKIGDVTYTYNQENAKNKLQIENLSGHPGKDEIVIYYKASAPDSNQNSDHDSKPNPPKVKKLAAPKKLQAVRTGTTKAKITFRKVKKADGYQISYADNKKFRKAKKLSTGKTTVILKKLKKNRKYYVRVRAYRKVNGVKKYGTYGKVQAIAKRPRS